MTLIQFFLAVPVALLAVALFHDFMAGLGEDRLWGPPFPDEVAAPAAVTFVETPCPEAAVPTMAPGVAAPGALKPAC